jgi:hypothetical protein
LNIIFSLQNQPQLLLVGNFIDILFIVRIFENKLFFLKYVAAKYKEKHYHDALNQGDGVEQHLSICFSKSCDKHFMVNNRPYMYGVPVDIHFHELNNQKPISVISI